MNEIEMLARLRADTPEPREAVLSSARSRLLDVAAGAATTARPAARHRVRRRRVLVRAGMAAGLAALMAVGVVAAESVTIGGQPVGAQAEAAQVLHRAARFTLDHDSSLRPGQYRYVRLTNQSLVSTGGKLPSLVVDQVSETWMPARFDDIWMLRRNDFAAVHYHSPADEAKLKAAGVDFQPRQWTLTARSGAFYGKVLGTWQDPDPEFLAALPRDPKELRDYMYRAQGGSHSAYGALGLVSDALVTGRVPADLSAAFFQALALVPGITLVPGATNLAGRTGVAVAAKTKDLSAQLVFDDTTGAYIGSRGVLLRVDGWDVPPGTPLYASAVEVAVVDRIGSRPHR